MQEKSFEVFEGLEAKQFPEDIAVMEKELIECQFDHPREITVNNAGKPDVLKIIDLHKENLKTETPTIICRGWAMDEGIYGDVAKDLAANYDRRVLMTKGVHGIDIGNIIESATAAGRKIPEVLLRKVAALLKTIEAADAKKVKLAGHSEGAILVVLAAILRPDKIEDIILYNPAGLTGQDSTARLVAGAAADSVVKQAEILAKSRAREMPGALSEDRAQILLNKGRAVPEQLAPLMEEGKVTKEQAERLNKEGAVIKESSDAELVSLMEALKTDPVGILQAVEAIAHTQIQDLLPLLREKGIKIAVVLGEGDHFFPIDKVKRNLAGGDAEDGKNSMYDALYRVDGTHGALNYDPEQSAALIDRIFDEFDELRAKEAAAQKAADLKEQIELSGN